MIYRVKSEMSRSLVKDLSISYNIDIADEMEKTLQKELKISIRNEYRMKKIKFIKERMKY